MSTWFDIDSGPVTEAVLAFHASNAEVQLAMINAGKEQLQGAWIPALEQRAVDDLDRSVIVAGSRVLVGSGGFTLLAAQSDAPLTNGLEPTVKWYAVEMGARTRRATINTHSPLGRPYKVTKMLNRGLPTRQRYGRIAFDAASEIGKKLVGVWVDAYVGTYARPLGADVSG